MTPSVSSSWPRSTAATPLTSDAVHRCGHRSWRSRRTGHLTGWCSTRGIGSRRAIAAGRSSRSMGHGIVPLVPRVGTTGLLPFSGAIIRRHEALRWIRGHRETPDRAAHRPSASRRQDGLAYHDDKAAYLACGLPGTSSRTRVGGALRHIPTRGRYGGPDHFGKPAVPPHRTVEARGRARGLSAQANGSAHDDDPMRSGCRSIGANPRARPRRAPCRRAQAFEREREVHVTRLTYVAVLSEPLHFASGKARGHAADSAAVATS